MTPQDLILLSEMETQIEYGEYGEILVENLLQF